MDAEFVGKTLEEAKELLKKEERMFRVRTINGEPQMGTCDFVEDRINLAVQDGKVIGFTLG